MAKLNASERLVTHHSLTIDTKFRTKATQEVKAQCICPVPEMYMLAPLIDKQKGLVHSYDSGNIVV
ncbi:hypothetical protein ACWTVY_21115, partial [Escherichia coli]